MAVGQIHPPHSTILKSVAPMAQQSPRNSPQLLLHELHHRLVRETNFPRAAMLAAARRQAPLLTVHFVRPSPRIAALLALSPHVRCQARRERGCAAVGRSPPPRAQGPEPCGRARRHRPAALAAVPRRSAAGWPCRRAAVPLSPRRRAVDKAAAGAPAPGERRGRGRRARGASACGPPPQSRTRARAPHAGRRRRPRHARGLRVQAQGRGVLAVAGWGAEATRRVGGEHRMAWRDGPLNC